MSLGHTDEALAYYDAQTDWRAAMAAPRLRRDLDAQRAESAALAAELAPLDRAPETRARIEAAASARAEARRDVGDLLAVLLGAP